MTKHIWIINHYAITPEYAGGTRHYELASCLSKNGYKVVVFASSVLHQNSTDSILHKKEKYNIVDVNNNFKFIWIQALTYKGNGIRRIFNMISFVFNILLNYKRLIKTGKIQIPEIIVGSSVHPFVPLLTKYLSMKFSSRYIFEIRDLWPKSFIDLEIWKEKSIISKIFYFIEKVSLKNAKAIINLSPLTKQYLIDRYKVQESKIFYIPNGTSLYKSDSTYSKTADQIKSTKKFNIVFTGSIILSNRVDLVCEIAKTPENNENIFFHIVGDGQEKFFLIEKYKYLNNIRWYDSVPKKEIQLVLNSADVLLLIQGNVAWGSSNKLYDYLAAGKPIVSCVWVEHNDVISKINAGVSVSSESLDDLYNAILKIYNSTKKETNAMGKNAIDYVKHYHNWDTLSKKFEEVINIE